MRIQWRNRRGGGTGFPSETSDREISADLSGKDFKWGKKKENWKSEGEKFKMEGGLEKIQNEERIFFFFFTFQNDWNLFWVYQNGNFLLWKSISRRRGKMRKMTCPFGKINFHACYVPVRISQLNISVNCYGKLCQNKYILANEVTVSFSKKIKYKHSERSVFSVVLRRQES